MNRVSFTQGLLKLTNFFPGRIFRASIEYGDASNPRTFPLLKSRSFMSSNIWSTDRLKSVNKYDVTTRCNPLRVAFRSAFRKQFQSSLCRSVLIL